MALGRAFEKTPEGKRHQVDAALDYALECTLAERPNQPLLLVAEKLRAWDAAVASAWPLRAEAEAVYAKADGDGSGQLDLSELSSMRQSEEYASLMLASVDKNLDGKVSLIEWLLAMKANYDTAGEEATRKVGTNYT